MKEANTYIKLLTFNTWGLKYVSKHRKERLKAIADRISGEKHPLYLLSSDTQKEDVSTEDDDLEDYDIIALQEIWCQEDWDYILKKCKSRFPYSRWFSSGIIAGPGLAILSKIPIESTFLYRFPINGRPSAFWRGDWYVGKSISITVLRPINNLPQIVILNSHMHAPYSLNGDAAYYCHRSCQAWDFSKIANIYKRAGYAVVIVGDLNSKPGSLPHKFLTHETGLVDSWEQLYGVQDCNYIAKLSPKEQIEYGGITCDSKLNTWRSDRALEEACRLDYALIDPLKLKTVSAQVKFTEKIPNIGSFSDHFAYSCTLQVLPHDSQIYDNFHDCTQLLEKVSNYDEMIQVLNVYMKTAKRQKLWRGFHFWLAVLVLIIMVCTITSISNVAGWTSVIWILVAIIIVLTGLIDGLISFLFGNKEIRALKEVTKQVHDSRRNIKSILQHKNL